MSTTQSPNSRQANRRGDVRIVIATRPDDEQLQDCLDSIARHSASAARPLRVDPSAQALNIAFDELAPADVVVLEGPCLLTPGWLEHLQEAARADTNTATASALVDIGTPLAILDQDSPGMELAALAESLSRLTLRLLPHLSRIVGPCVYVRREALELAGPLDEKLELYRALEVDFSERCIRAGLAHVAADNVVVQPLVTVASGLPEPPPQRPESSVLTRALEAARGPRTKLWVTLDARALDGAITGTQVNILELILALADTGELRLRLLVRPARIDRETLELLRALPGTEILSEDDLDPTTPRSTIFHRPQQAFAPEDVELALALGERIVLSQLDLIAYRNPGYFEDAGAWEAYRRASRHGLSASERVLVFSDHTRRELIGDALVEDERIRVIPPGLNHRGVGDPQRPAELPAELPGAGFLLCLGTDFTHKNRVFALRLHAALREELGWEGALVLAGTHIPRGSSRDAEQDFLAERPALRGSVITLGAVSEQEKSWLLDHAAAVLYPSAYEGFGLVPFESALSGAPCLFAAQSSLGEVAPEGTATILPWDPSLSARAAHGLLIDDQLRARHLDALAGAARKLTWASAATATVQAYREAAIAPVRDAATLSRDMVEREAALTAAHQVVVKRLIGEREHAQRMYDQLNAEVGFGLSLIGPNGTLPENVQRALLTLSARPALSRPLYGLVSKGFALARALGRLARRPGRGR